MQHLQPIDWTSVAIFFGAGIVLLSAILAYTYSHLLAADAESLGQLRAEGLLVGDPQRDYHTLNRLLNSIAPAVSMRTEYWVLMYACVVRVMGAFGAHAWMRAQMERLVAHQALRYCYAQSSLAAMSSYSAEDAANF